MSSSSPSKFCPKCGGPIPVEAPQGLCPKCLLLQASIPTDAGKGASSQSTPPTHEELVAAFPQLEILELIGQGGMGFVFQAEAARQLDLNEGAVKVAIHRLRRRFREVIKNEIDQTVNDRAQVDEELHCLLEALS